MDTSAYILEVNALQENDLPDIHIPHRHLSESAADRPWSYFSETVMNRHKLVSIREIKSGRVVAMGLLIERYMLHPRAFIDDIVTHPDHRQRGLSKAIENKLCEIARSLGIEEIELTSRKHRSDAHAHWEKSGYTFVGMTRKYRKRLDQVKDTD